MIESNGRQYAFIASIAATTVLMLISVVVYVFISSSNLSEKRYYDNKMRIEVVDLNKADKDAVKELDVKLEKVIRRQDMMMDLLTEIRVNTGAKEKYR